jgi:hypothetical protein
MNQQQWRGIMNSPASLTRLQRLFAIVIAGTTPAILACTGGGDSSGGEGGSASAAASAAPACAVPSDSIVGGALDHFITTRTPVPSRMLIQPGATAVPDGATYVLNTMGRAHYIWPTDPEMQKQQIDNMRAKGPYVTMVVFYHGIADRSDGRKLLTFSGQYIDRANDGKKVDPTGITFDCQAPEGSRFAVDGAAPSGGAGPSDAAAPRGSGGDD